MDAREAARLEEYYRRWLRPDWRRWLHPDWERRVPPAQRAAMREDFAARDRAFETPLARRWRKEKEEREREEQERLEAEHQAEIEREALEIKAEIAELRYELMWAELCRKYGYNPSQPRVPAGHSDGGQWTNGGGGTQSSTGATSDRALRRNDPRVLSDATPDNLFRPGSQLARNDRSVDTRVDLREEEARGGHTIRTCPQK
jgi:hypothetical protein